MPLFVYQEAGAKKPKEIWAESMEGAKELLVRDNIWFFHLRAKTGKQKALSLEEKILFFQDLYQLLKAGIVLFEAVELIEQKMHLSFKAQGGIKEALKKGKSFSHALQETGGFDPILTGMIRMGEISGQMTEVVGEILIMLKKKQWMKKQLISAISYPAFLLTLAFIVLTVLLCFLVPSLQDLFGAQKLPLITQAIIATSDFVTTHFLLIPFALASFLFSLYRFFPRAPLYKLSLIKELEMARFSRTLYALVVANVPLVEGLNMCSQVTHNPLFLDAITQAVAKIHQGVSIADSFRNNPMISPLFCRMLETAEKTGSLKEVLAQAAEMYEEKIDTALKQMLAILQPLLIILIGLIIGTIMVAILVPMTDISAFLDE